MRRTLWSICALVLTLAPGSVLAAEPMNARDADRERIRAHLSGVEAKLRSLDTSGWPADKREARARAIETLHRYARRGEFPVNTGHPGATHPYFIDDDGRACAVAHLMLESGADELARAVQREHGLDYVADMRTPGIAAWAERSGLTVAELAAIQPGYCNCEDQPQFDPVCGTNGLSYWNTCVAEVCGGVTIEHAGTCADPAITCEPPVVTQCGQGISDGLCNPVGGGDAEPAWDFEALEWLEDPDCPDVEPETGALNGRGCALAGDGERGAGGPFALLCALLALGLWSRRRR